MSDTNESDSNDDGQCCFCGEECNPASQACGQCVRNGPMHKAFFTPDQEERIVREELTLSDCCQQQDH